VFDAFVSALLFSFNHKSSITEWVDILTSSSYDDEVYDG